MKFFTKVSDAWKLGKKIFVRQNGAWKEVTKAFVKQGGAWKQFYTKVVNTFFATTTNHTTLPSGTTQSASASVSPSFPDHGGQIYFIYVTTVLSNNGQDYPSQWQYYLLYDQTAPPPNYAGNLRLTNVSSGVTMVLSKTSGNNFSWQLFVDTNSTNPNTLNPYEGIVRNGATDLFKVEEA